MFLILLSVLVIGKIAALSNQEFREKYADQCFEKKDQWKPQSAVSLENFIYMVEKLERTVNMDGEGLTRMLLDRFSCNRLLLSSNNIWDRDSSAVWFEKILQTFLKDLPNLPELDFTKEDECQMFFMLSPALQKVVETHDSENEDEKFYEHGVISTNADAERAVDLSKVLYGILAGFKNIRKPIEEFINGDVPSNYTGQQLDILFSLTMSEVINTLVERLKTINGKSYSNIGKWTSTDCPKEYIHDDENGIRLESVWPTLAEMIGAVDGFILGSKIVDMKTKDMKLSQILRMYYTQQGFKKNLGDQHAVSYCNRTELYSSVLNNNPKLERQTLNYMAVYLKLKGSPLLNKEENDIRNAVKNFNLENILKQTEAEKMACAANKKTDICETPSNVFVILDRKDGNITAQKSTTGELISGLNIGLDEDTITIYSNADVGDIRTIVNASDSKAYASCTLEEYNEYEVPNNAEDSKVLGDIRNVLSTYEDNQKSLHGVPAKVVVYFNFRDASKLTDELAEAERQFKTRHPYVTVIPIGVDRAYLEHFTNKQPSNVLLWSSQNLVSNLKNRICEAPAVLQHSDCRTKSKYQDNEYTDYIRELHIHHWTMYPKYFLKTFGYKFQFTAEYGKIRVCFSRVGPIVDSGNPQSCKETSLDSSSIEFTGSNPCKGRTVHSCNPFYFSVFGRDDGSENACKREIDSKDVGCKRLDQIEYTIKHEGISCSSAKQLISSPLFQTLLTFFVLLYILAQQK